MKPGEVIQGKYRLDQRLGVGGMGEVWRATHTGTGREFAIKFLHAHVASSALARERFAREARASAQINHATIIDIFDVGEHDGGTLYLVMELLTGVLLGDAFSGEPPLTIRDFLTVMHDVAAGIGAAHAAGIVHRDLKPENIFLHRDRASGVMVPRVLDFGIGKFASSGGASPTASGVFLGSPRYMSPEQSRSATNADSRSDLWSFGVILFEGLTGTRPHEGNSFSSLVLTICTTPPASIDDVAPHLPEAVRSIVRDCLKPLDERITDAGELAARIASALEDPAVASALLPRPREQPSSPAKTIAGMRFRTLGPGSPLSMPSPSSNRGPLPSSSSNRGPLPSSPSAVLGAPAESTPAGPLFRAVARTIPINPETQAKLQGYVQAAQEARKPAAFVPTAHTAKVDPEMLAAAARIVEAKRAAAAAAQLVDAAEAVAPPRQPALSPRDLQPQSLQPQSLQPQPLQQQQVQTLLSPQPLPPQPRSPEPSHAPKRAVSPTSPLEPSPPHPSLTSWPEDPPASPWPLVVPAAAPPARSSGGLWVAAGILTILLAGIVTALVITMRSPVEPAPGASPAPAAEPVPTASLAPSSASALPSAAPKL